jgi:hypothetical protein
MTGSAFEAMDVGVGSWSQELGGGLEEGGLEIGPQRRPSDDGKRLPVLDVVFGLFLGENLLELGGGPGGGGQKIGPDRRDSDLFLSLKNNVLPAWELTLAHY